MQVKVGLAALIECKSNNVTLWQKGFWMGMEYTGTGTGTG